MLTYLIIVGVWTVNGVAANLNQTLRLVFVWIVNENELCHVKRNHHVAAKRRSVSANDSQELFE